MHEAWGLQIKGLTDVSEPNDDEEATTAAAAGECFDEMEQAAGGIEVCCFDNRGMGRSSVPSTKSKYSTSIIARDALALLDHLGWKKVHVFVHSMGSMIACKLAAMSPERILSLALLNATGGGFECFPKGTQKKGPCSVLTSRSNPSMASIDLVKKAKEAFVDNNFELVVDLYTQAIDLDPKSTDLYVPRQTSNLGASQMQCQMQTKILN